MTTLPRASKLAVPNPFFQRTQSEFDAGLNTSAAWTEHLESSSISGSLSDEEPDIDETSQRQAHRPGRALYDFEGKAEFRELSVSAGDALEVVKEDLADGWSLVKNAAGEVGLLPRTYYTVRFLFFSSDDTRRSHFQFTSDFTPAPDLEPSTSTKGHSQKEPSSSDSATPRGSLYPDPSKILIPQNTGEWHRMFPSFRQSLLGGKTLNRFSSFVTSGAEAYVLKGTAESAVISDNPPPAHGKSTSDSTIDEDEDDRLHRLGLGAADRHFVDTGPAWKEKSPPFRVLVHSPSKRSSTFSGAYTVYSITSLFHPPSTCAREKPIANDDSKAGVPGSASSHVTVYRRFSHFVILHAALNRRLPGLALPPLPEKQYTGRFSQDFVEARRGDLERYIGRVVRHPVARYAEVVTFFLGCENDSVRALYTAHRSAKPEHCSMMCRSGRD